MAQTVQRYIEWDGKEYDLDVNRKKLTIDEAIEVERLAGVPFYSEADGQLPLPLWAAIVFVELRRQVPGVKWAEVRKASIGAVSARVVGDPDPDDVDAEPGQAPDPTAGGADTAEPSPPDEPSTSAASPTS